MTSGGQQFAAGFLNQEYGISPAEEPLSGNTIGILETAQNGGIPVALPEVLPASLLQAPYDEAIASIAAVLKQNPVWSAFETPLRLNSRLLPSAIVDICYSDGSAREARFSFTPGPAAIREIASSLRILFRAETFGQNVGGEDPFEFLSVRPSIGAWLSAGFDIITLSVRPDHEEAWGVATSNSDQISFGDQPPSWAAALAMQLARIWPFAFEARFAGRNAGGHLVDICVSDDSENRNTELLAKLLADGRPLPNGIVANCTPFPRQSLTAGTEALATGHAQGDRWAYGPLATSLETAIKFRTAGEAPILVLDRLRPSQAHLLSGIAALALRQDGPASHITILARTAGLAVLSNVQQKSPAWPSDGTIVTLSESLGALIVGKSQPDQSTTRFIGPRLFRRYATPVALAAGVPTEKISGRSIGLCRSEMQIQNSPEAPIFLDYLARFGAAESEKPVPQPVADRMEASLDTMLETADGELVNYRLMDADLHEVLAGHPDANLGSRTVDSRGLRGPRWALANGFYRWQVDMAVRVTARHSRQGSTNVAITVPSVFGLSEVAAVRRLFDTSLGNHSGAADALRFGVMIETPRMCAHAPLLPMYAEVFSFGLNDLTASVYGLERSSWDSFGHYYVAAGLLGKDPFSALDVPVVGRLVKNTIATLRSSGAKGPVFLCGEAANSASAHTISVQNDNVYVSVPEADWASAVISSASEKTRLAKGLGFPRNASLKHTHHMTRRATTAVRIGHTDLAAEAALKWFSIVAPMSDKDDMQNWKVLKKRLVSALFGELQGKFFAPNWDAEQVSSYAQNLMDGPETVRISQFPIGISCHARSEALESTWNDDQLRNFIAAFDNLATLHVFPQQNADQLCFRAVFGAEGLLVEAGWGQAMYVFEAERGQHPIAVARLDTDGHFRFEHRIAKSHKVMKGLKNLVSSHKRWLLGAGRIVSAMLGLEQFAIEGYFDPDVPSELKVVDMDLPLDIAWNVTS